MDALRSLFKMDEEDSGISSGNDDTTEGSQEVTTMDDIVYACNIGGLRLLERHPSALTTTSDGWQMCQIQHNLRPCLSMSALDDICLSQVRTTRMMIDQSPGITSSY